MLFLPDAGKSLQLQKYITKTKLTKNQYLP